MTGLGSLSEHFRSNQRTIILLTAAGGRRPLFAPRQQAKSWSTAMQPTREGLAGATTKNAVAPAEKRRNGGNGAGDESTADLTELLHALQAMRVGDFSVRLPGEHTGLIGKISDA